MKRIFSLTKGAQEFGVEPKTLRAALVRHGIEVERGKRYTVLEISDSLYDEAYREKVREVRARRIGLQMRNEAHLAQLVERSTAEQVYALIVPVLRARLNALPDEAAAVANPTDPQFAHRALTAWLNANLPMIRAELPKTPRK